jgi:hypothetical protein
MRICVRVFTRKDSDMTASALRALRMKALMQMVAGQASWPYC